MAKGHHRNVLSSFCQTTKFQKRNVDTKVVEQKSEPAVFLSADRRFKLEEISLTADWPAARSKSGVCGRSLSENSSSNPALCCQVETTATGRSLVQGSLTVYVFLLAYMCVCVCVSDLVQ